MKRENKYASKFHRAWPEKCRRAVRLSFQTGLVIIFGLAVTLIAVFGRKAAISAKPLPVPVTFSGEYSQNGGEWKPLTKASKLNALDGDVILSGSFDIEKDTVLLHVCLDYISLCVKVDGVEEIRRPSGDYNSPDDIGTLWVSWESAALSGKNVEIHLSNMIDMGNPNAYNDFLQKMYIGQTATFEGYILNPANYIAGGIQNEGAAALETFLYGGQLWRGMGFFACVIALILFGTALADELQGKLFGNRLWLLCALSFFAAGAMAFDTPDVNLWSASVIFNTCTPMLCRMLWMLALSLWTAELCTAGRRRWCYIAAAAGMIFDIGLLLFCLFKNTYITSAVTPWIVMQGTICPVLTFSCIMELGNKRDKRALISVLALLCAVGAELLNARFGFCQRCIVINSVLIILLLVYMVWAVKNVSATYRVAKRVEEQEKELARSRVSVMLSQIQPHFLYNALSSIQCLCREDPAAAEQATATFSEFLRVNMDSLTMDKPIGFEKELRHVKHYLALEALRFPDKLKVEYNIETEMFTMPTLTLQPIVENAVRYGVTKRLTGGTVRIGAKETLDSFVVTVEDDGVGFDPMLPHEDGRTHIGIQNVHDRLERMCGGTLKLQSTVGVGTIAVITIPKKEEEK